MMDMYNLGRVLGEVIKLGSHKHALRTALELALWHNAFALEKMKKQSCIIKHSGESWSESEENENVKMRPEFKLDNSALY